jgi:hypothetical protein
MKIFKCEEWEELTRYPSLVQNWVRLKKKPAKKYISLKGRGLNSEMHHFFCGKLSFSISYQVWIKLPYFANLTQRGDRVWKEAQRQGDFNENSTI